MERYELKNWFIPHAKGVVVDVGASVGGYTVRACKKAKLVIAIEAEEETFTFLRKNVELNCPRDRVLLMRKAVGDRRGKSLLKIPVRGELVDTGVASLRKPRIACNSYKYEEVDVDTLDNIVASLGIDRIDFLKIDIEGAEADAFKGMERSLRKTKYLMIEIHQENTWLINELKKIGFKLVDRKGINYFLVNKLLE
jgi:FkbM family methyltransferase